jgi:diketogulonate reductase-like aldo/keto reductase
MRLASFGVTQRQVSVIGQGSWYLDAADRDQAIASIRQGLDLGMTHIDTAEMYGAGAAEALVGEAIRGRRDEVFLVSKVLPSNASRLETRQSCERSLKHLGTDRLDCYLLHWRGHIPLEETFAAFEELVDEGKILSYGVSNFDVEDLEEATYVVGPGKLACNQVLYHLKQRAIEHAVLPWCARNDMAVVAYSPFGHDDFPNSQSQGGQVLKRIGRECGASPRQVALAFLTRHPIVFAIPKSVRPDNVKSNAEAGDIVLTAEHLAKLEHAFPLGTQPRYLPTI